LVEIAQQINRIGVNRAWTVQGSQGVSPPKWPILCWMGR